MLFLFSDESRNPKDAYWGIGSLITANPKKVAEDLRQIRTKYGYLKMEMKYSSNNYSQILPAIRCLDYFFEGDSFYYKIIIKDKSLFNIRYYEKNSYGMNPEDLAYVSTYSNLCCSIKPDYFSEKKKMLLYDRKAFVGSKVLKDFLMKKDKTLVDVIPKDSEEVDKNHNYTDTAILLQLCDLITGTIISYLYPESSGSRGYQVRNIYRKELMCNCIGILEKLKDKANYYYPNFSNQKVNVFYWKKRPVA